MLEHTALEAISAAYEQLKFGKIEKFTEHYTVTDRGVWCHVLSQKKLLEIQEKEQKSANYLPSPCLFIKSSLKKASPALCLLLLSKDIAVPEGAKNLCNFFSKKGLQIKRVDDAALTPLERIRGFKEASFIIAWHCSAHLSQLSLCASGTPFILAERQVQDVTHDYLRMANLSECLEGPTVEKVQEIYHNRELFAVLAADTLEQMKNLRTWKNFLYDFPRGSGLEANAKFPFSFDQYCTLPHLLKKSYAPGIFFCLNPREIFARKREAVLCPWICYICEDMQDIVRTDAFRTSMVTCLGALVQSESMLSTVQELLSPIPVAVLPLPVTVFRLETWRDTRLTRVICRDGICIQSRLDTLTSIEIDPSDYIDNEIVVCETAMTSAEMEQCLNNLIPFVCPEPLEHPMGLYPGFCDEKLDPHTVSEFLTVERVQNIVEYLELLQVERYCEKLQQTLVYTNCMRFVSVK